MTTQDTTTAQQPPPTYPPLNLLRRSRSDRKLAGVAGGLGRHAGIDPLILRILFVVLTVFGGTGVLLYAVGWLLIPNEGEQESEGQRLFNGRSSRPVATVIAMVVVLVVGLAAVGAMLDTGPGLGGLGVLIVLGVTVVLLLRNGQRPVVDQTPPTAAYGPVPPPEPGVYGQAAGTAYTTTAPVQGAPPPPPTWATTPVPPVPPRPPREKSLLGRITISTALIVVGLMVGWNTIADDDFRVVAIFGAALAVVAGGLLVGAFVGRARGLILLGLVLSMATAISAAADQHLSASMGERTWAPATVALAERDFRLGVGDAELDLTNLPAGSDVDVEVRLGVGELRVIVPTDARVVVEGHVGAGTMILLDEPTQDGTGLDATVAAEGTSSGTQTVIAVDASVGLGELAVRR
ncbi:MAG: PspC domain-containing protein [Sporichthyaceae bacterium]|nr:PspC domain-containing protein [Sporichthyaceae bacterium]